jgi:hypothetical protein
LSLNLIRCQEQVDIQQVDIASQKTYIVCTADKDWNEKIKTTSMNKLIDVTVAFDAIAGEQMSGTLDRIWLVEATLLPMIIRRFI